MQEAQMQAIIQQRVSQGVNALEKAADAKLEEMNTDAGLASIRRDIIRKMRKKEEMKREWIAKGHGTYRELGDQQEFFNVTKESDNVLVHFYRGTSANLCHRVDRYVPCGNRSGGPARVGARRAPVVPRPSPVARRRARGRSDR